MNRREFLSKSLTICIPALFVGLAKPFLSFGNSDFSFLQSGSEETTLSIFAQIMTKAQEKSWSDLPIGECMGNIGKLLSGTQYVGGTIEGPGPEKCRVVLTGLDCVTFFENVLCMSRILRKGKYSLADLIDEITFTRYRGGKLTDYTSRLHYTSDWIYDNEKKTVIKNVTKEIGGIEFQPEVSFMSDNPQYYSALKEFPEYIPKIAKSEQIINKRLHYFIPQNKIKRAQKHLQTGDIIAFVTSKKGLDYAHTGMVYREKKGKIRLFHVSSKKKKVLIDIELYKYVQSVGTHIGITVARPV